MKIRESGMPEETLWSTFFDVPQIVNALEINDSVNNIIEVGCGYGTFTTEVAKRVKETVYAFDIDQAMIEVAKEKAYKNKLNNIVFSKRDILTEGTGLGNQKVDYFMLFNILHHNQPLDLITLAYASLNTNGRLGIIHWRTDMITPRGPDMSIRPTPEQCTAWALQAGFVIHKKHFLLPPYHYGLILIKG